MDEINTLKIKINELKYKIKETTEKKDMIYKKSERSRIFALRSTIISTILNFCGYFIHPAIILASILYLGIGVQIGGISMLLYQNKEEKCQKEIDGYIKESEQLEAKLEELTVKKETPLTARKNEFIITKQKDNNIKKSR